MAWCVQCRHFWQYKDSYVIKEQNSHCEVWTYLDTRSHTECIHYCREMKDTAWSSEKGKNSLCHICTDSQMERVITRQSHRRTGRWSIMAVMILLWINQLKEVELSLGAPPQAINNQETEACSAINTHSPVKDSGLFDPRAVNGEFRPKAAVVFKIRKKAETVCKLKF